MRARDDLIHRFTLYIHLTLIIFIKFSQLFQDGVRLAAGYEDGTLKIWDLKASSVLHAVPASVHQIRITDIDTHPENNLMASISSDGKYCFRKGYLNKALMELSRLTFSIL